jgi:glutamine kinase
VTPAVHLGAVHLGAVRLGTKAETLERLAPLVTAARVLPLVWFSRARWQTARERLLDGLAALPWAAEPVIVRSSALTEDSAEGSQAGRFTSLPRRQGRAQVAAAVDEVLASYDGEHPADQVLIQPQLTGVRACGVACSYDPSSGAPYRVVNWSESGSTDAVTGGAEGGLWISYGAAGIPPADAPSPLVGAVWTLLAELTALTGEPCLDIEFAAARDGGLVLLQVRPLACRTAPVPPAAHTAALDGVARQLREAVRPRPRVLGRRTVFGVMPDWNPAEMIGLRPRPLSLSLYRFLVTDGVWARARHRHGYRDLRGVPLMADFSGLPYVDVAASATSFVPRDVPDDVAAALVDHWLDRLVAEPHLHDRIESRIVLSGYGFRTRERLAALAAAGFAPGDRACLGESLRSLTDRMVAGGLWQDDLARLGLLGTAPAAAAHAGGCPADGPGCCGPALLARLELCAAHGTYPFASLARAAFVATELLDDLVAEGALTAADKARFVGGLGLVAGELRRDFAALDRERFLKRYGHLRPGTYDILSPRYDEAPDRYFDWSARPDREPAPAAPFLPDRGRLRAIERLVAREGFSFGAGRLLEFAAAAIAGRERGKFEFTCVLSDVLTGVRRLGERHGLTADDMSHVEVATLGALTGDRAADARTLREAAARGRAAHAVTRTVVLPPLVTGERDVTGFAVPQAQPTFVTRGRVLAPVADIDAGDPPEGAIAVVASADPGYDWLFARGIRGLVTAFGGANSHMAIRALELGVPAVVGAGEALFRAWSAARALEIDAAGGLVTVVP